MKSISVSVDVTKFVKFHYCSLFVTDDQDNTEKLKEKLVKDIEVLLMKKKSIYDRE